MSRLTALVELRKQGALSEAEFEAGKARVLAGP
ncbi:SHOCT domain-containing protein [Streptomyces sp. NPDC047804]|nr:MULTISPECIES: SHOCT domain-containing protein [Streptomyces]